MLRVAIPLCFPAPKWALTGWRKRSWSKSACSALFGTFFPATQPYGLGFTEPHSVQRALLEVFEQSPVAQQLPKITEAAGWMGNSNNAPLGLPEPTGLLPQEG